jgi:hypothetical protein
MPHPNTQDNDDGTANDTNGAVARNGGGSGATSASTSRMETPHGHGSAMDTGTMVSDGGVVVAITIVGRFYLMRNRAPSCHTATLTFHTRRASERNTLWSA